MEGFQTLARRSAGGETAVVVLGGDGGSSARAIEVRKVERKMERRVRRDRVGGGVGVSIADFFGEATEEVNCVDEERGVSLSTALRGMGFL